MYNILMFYITLFLYIAALLAGTAATTICIIMMQRKKEGLQKNVLEIMLAFLAYLVMSVLLGLLISKSYDHLYVWIAVVFCDLAYFAVIISWIHLLLALTGKQETRWRKPVMGLIIGYVIAVESLVLITETVDAMHHGTFAFDYNMRLIVKSLNVLFMLLILFCAVRFLVYAINNMKEDQFRRIVVILSVLLMAEILFSAYQDQFLGPYHEGDISATLWIDPLLILFLLLSVGMLLRFRQRGMPAAAQAGVDMEQVLDAFAQDTGLTKRETELLHLVYEGYNNEEIADELGISMNTVKHHLSHLFSKCGVRGKHELLSVIAQEIHKKTNP